MKEWLLIFIVYSQSAGTYMGGVDTDVTLHDFPSSELCESAAEHLREEVEGTFKTEVSYKCLKNESGGWR